MLFTSSRSQSRLQKEDIEEALIREIEESLRDGEPGVAEPAPDQDEKLPSNPLRFVTHFLRYYRWPLLTIVLLELGQAVCQILIPKAVQGLIDSAVPLQGNLQVSIWSALAGPLKLFVILNIGILLFSRSSGALLVTVGPVLRRRVRSSLYRYLQGHSQRYFMGNFAGSLSNRVAEVSMGVNHSLWTLVCDFWPVTVTLAVSLILLMQVHSGLGLVLGLWTFGYISVSYVLAMRCREYAKVFAAARSAVSGRIVDAVTNVMNSKLFARMDYERQHLPRSRSSSCAPHLLVYGTHALVPVHRDACLAGGHDRLCRRHLGKRRDQRGFLCDGRKPAAHGDQRRAKSEPEISGVL
jgi:ABC-type bacteriocin/lantibiotic exporter with double-glycine peptidase domain